MINRRRDADREDRIVIEVASDASEETQQAIADWHYWVNQGYKFG